MEYKRVLQIGAGGVGFYCALALNRSLPHGVELQVFDADNFIGGLGHSRLPRISNPATKKVALLRNFSAGVMGDAAIKVVDGLFTGAEACEGDLIVDCSDMALEVRRPVWELAQANGGRCVRVSYDGLNETVVVAQGLPFAHSGKSGYREAPNTALSFMAGGIGALAVLKILAGWEQHVEFQVQLSDHFMPLAAPVSVSEAESIAVEPVPVRKRRQRVR